MKKIICGAVIALIGVIYSITLMVLATVYDVHSDGASGLWGLLQDLMWNFRLSYLWVLL